MSGATADTTQHTDGAAGVAAVQPTTGPPPPPWRPSNQPQAPAAGVAAVQPTTGPPLTSKGNSPGLKAMIM